MRSEGLTGPGAAWPREAAERLAVLPLRDYRPQRRLVTPVTEVPLPAVPAVDAHNHLGRWLTDDGGWAVDVVEFVDTMRAAGVVHVVNLDGRWGDELDANLRRYDESYPELFSTFCQVDLSLLAEPGAAAALETQLRAGVDRGAKGLKVWKNLGLEVRDERGELVLPDSPLLHPLFEAAGELDLPVTIHVADPAAFFDPLDERNERLENLLEYPEWWFGRDGLPSFDRLLDGLEAVVAEHPGTTFIGAHVGCDAEDLGRVSRMLDDYSNYHVDLGARMAELGRQPRAAARLVLEHPRQVLFGTDDFPAAREDYARWYRFLESDDECFAYGEELETPAMGRWEVSALALPGEVLEALYAGNARRLLGL